MFSALQNGVLNKLIFFLQRKFLYPASSNYRNTKQAKKKANREDKNAIPEKYLTILKEGQNTELNKTHYFPTYH